MPCSTSASWTIAWRRGAPIALRPSTRRRDSLHLSGFRLARPAPLHDAFGAFAALRLEEKLEIFLAIVVSDLVARLDVRDCAQDHLALDHVGFGVGTAGVIGVARDVAAARAVDGPAAVDLVEIARAARFEPRRLRIADAAAPVGDDERALVDRRGGEQPQPGRRAADAIGLVG